MKISNPLSLFIKTRVGVEPKYEKGRYDTTFPKTPINERGTIDPLKKLVKASLIKFSPKTC